MKAVAEIPGWRHDACSREATEFSPPRRGAAVACRFRRKASAAARAASSEDDQARRLKDLLQALQAEGWLMSVRAMFEPNARDEPYVFDTGLRMTRIWWALSRRLPYRRRLPARSASSRRLGPPVCDRMAARSRGNSPPCRGAVERTDHSWGFLALWEWNDAWSAATKAERRAYDEECDVAFKGDVELGINIAGRHRLDWASRWHHRGAMGGALARTR